MYEKRMYGWYSEKARLAGNRVCLYETIENKEVETTFVSPDINGVDTYYFDDKVFVGEITRVLKQIQIPQSKNINFRYIHQTIGD